MSKAKAKYAVTYWDAEKNKIWKEYFSDYSEAVAFQNKSLGEILDI